jgi:hypothetical protein
LRNPVAEEIIFSQMLIYWFIKIVLN